MADYTVPFAPTSYRRPERYTNPYIGTLLDLMQRQAAAQADYDQRRMQLSGQLWQGLGQTGANIVQAIAEAPAQRRQAEVQRLQMEELRQQAADATTQRESGRLLQEAWAMGDPEAAAQQLQRIGRGDLVPPFLESAGKAAAARDALGEQARKNTQRQADALTQMVQRNTTTAPLLQEGVAMPTPEARMMPVGSGFIAALPPAAQAGAQQVSDTMMGRQRTQDATRREDAINSRRAARLAGNVETYGQLFPVAPAAMRHAPVPLTKDGDIDYTNAIKLMEDAKQSSTLPSDLARALARYAASRGKRPEEVTYEEELAVRRQLDEASRDPRAPVLPIILQGPNGPLAVTRVPGQAPTATPVVGPDNQPVPRTPTGAERLSVANDAATLALLNDIEASASDEWIGPIAGRWANATKNLPGMAPSTAQATFYANVATLRNQMINLLSGAAVSAAEERRMLDQLPDPTQNPSVFRANLAATKKNRERLLTMKGGGAPTPGTEQ